MGFAALALRVWEPDLWIRVYNQARLSGHLFAAGALGSAALWLAFHPVRILRGARGHAWVFVGYLWMFAWMGLTVAETDAEWIVARLSFRAGLLACLLLWAGYQCSQFRHTRLKDRQTTITRFKGSHPLS